MIVSNFDGSGSFNRGESPLLGYSYGSWVMRCNPVGCVATQILTHTHTGTHTHTHTHTHMHAHAHTRMHARTHSHTHTHTHKPGEVTSRLHSPIWSPSGNVLFKPTGAI